MATYTTQTRGTAAGSALLELLAELTDEQHTFEVHEDDPCIDERPASGRWEIEADTTGLPEGVTLLTPRRTPAARTTPAAPSGPPIEERIKQMPRFRSSADTHHPTGGHWVAPTERQLLGRPPA